MTTRIGGDCSALPAEPEGDQTVASADAELPEDDLDVRVQGGRPDAEVRRDQLLRSIGEQARQHPAFHRRERRTRDEETVGEQDLPMKPGQAAHRVDDRSQSVGCGADVVRHAHRRARIGDRRGEGRQQANRSIRRPEPQCPASELA